MAIIYILLEYQFRILALGVEKGRKFSLITSDSHIEKRYDMNKEKISRIFIIRIG